MKTTGIVFDGKQYWAPFGAAMPPTGIPDISRYGYNLTDAVAPAEPDWEQLPSGLWVKEYDGNDYASLTVANWRDYDVAGTIMGWIKSSVVTGNQTIFASSDTGTDTSFLQLRLVATTGFLEIVQQDGGALNQITGDVACGDGVWHHCVVTGNGTAYILYVDGVVQALTVTAGLNTGNWFYNIPLRDNISVGAMVNTGIVDYITGYAAPPRVYDYVLSQDAINKIYESERYLFGV